MSEIFSKILKDKNGKVLNVGSKYQQPDWGAEEPEIVLPENTYELAEGQGVIAQEFFLEAGQTYVVNYNGVDYECVVVVIEETGVAIGNVGAATGGNPTTEPFVIVRANDDQIGDIGAYGIVMDITGAASATFSVRKETVHKIPGMYLDAKEPLIVKHDGNALLGGFTCEMIVEAIKKGRTVFLQNISSTSLKACAGLNARENPVFISAEELYISVSFINDNGTISSIMYSLNAN